MYLISACMCKIYCVMHVYRCKLIFSKSEGKIRLTDRLILYFMLIKLKISKCVVM